MGTVGSLIGDQTPKSLRDHKRDNVRAVRKLDQQLRQQRAESAQPPEPSFKLRQFGNVPSRLHQVPHRLKQEPVFRPEEDLGLRADDYTEATPPRHRSSSTPALTPSKESPARSNLAKGRVERADVADKGDKVDRASCSARAPSAGKASPWALAPKRGLAEAVQRRPSTGVCPPGQVPPPFSGHRPSTAGAVPSAFAVAASPAANRRPSTERPRPSSSERMRRPQSADARVQRSSIADAQANARRPRSPERPAAKANLSTLAGKQLKDQKDQPEPGLHSRARSPPARRSSSAGRSRPSDGREVPSSRSRALPSAPLLPDWWPVAAPAPLTEASPQRPWERELHPRPASLAKPESAWGAW